jgi:hypothetical protein
MIVLGYLLLFLLIAHGAAAEEQRLDLYTKDGWRDGWAVVDEQTGRPNAARAACSVVGPGGRECRDLRRIDVGGEEHRTATVARCRR